MIDLWTWSLEISASVRNNLVSDLSTDERARARRFVSDQDGNHFIAGRGVLRRILADYLSISPSDIAIDVTQRGKPYIKTAATPFYFNLSHSGPNAALGISRDHEIGVDIEQVRPVTEGLAERFFSPAECKALSALPPHERQHAFFQCWTRKEAFVKASGEGFFRALDSFTVEISDADRTQLLHLDDEPAAISKWQFLNFKLADDLLGSVAVPSPDPTIALHWHILTPRDISLK